MSTKQMPGDSWLQVHCLRIITLWSKMSHCCVSLHFDPPKKSKGYIHVQYMRFRKWHWCCLWASEIVADPINLSRLSLSHPLSLLSGGEARWSLDDPQTDPRHQHESAWAAGESLHCECLLPLCFVLAGFSRCLRKQRGLHSATTGTGFNTFTGGIISESWRFWKLFCVIQAYLLREPHLGKAS